MPFPEGLVDTVAVVKGGKLKVFEHRLGCQRDAAQPVVVPPDDARQIFR